MITISTAVFGAGIAWQVVVNKADAADAKASQAIQDNMRLRLEVRQDIDELSNDFKEFSKSQQEMYRFMIRWKKEGNND